MASAEDWQLDKSVVQCNEHMLENQLLPDVTFILTLGVKSDDGLTSKKTHRDEPPRKKADKEKKEESSTKNGK